MKTVIDAVVLDTLKHEDDVNNIYKFITNTNRWMSLEKIINII
jgi:hypothetical protein